MPFQQGVCLDKEDLITNKWLSLGLSHSVSVPFTIMVKLDTHLSNPFYL